MNSIATSKTSGRSAFAALMLGTMLWSGAGAVGAELPAAIEGAWIQDVREANASPRLIVFASDSATIDGERCALKATRGLLASRWYADFDCGSGGALHPVWLDINLLLESDRLMVNRRPLAEAEVYIRQAAASGERAR